MAPSDLNRRCPHRLVLGKVFVRGLLAFVPYVNALLSRAAHGGGGARYCYAVWLRHLVRIKQAGGVACPRAVAELGPGDSLGTGLAALLSGAETYYALDVRPYAESAAVNLKVLGELVAMFRARAPIPGEDEFPDLFPRLDSYEFPASILHEDRLRKTLADDRLAELRRSVLDPHRRESCVRYIAPYSLGAIPGSSIDLLFSQGALCYIADLPEMYQAMNSWLIPGGIMSHQIDFGAAGTASVWNRHWAYSRITWRLMRGGRPYWPSRAPHSAYIRAALDGGFEILADLRTPTSPEGRPPALARDFRHLSTPDLTTRGCLLVARKHAVATP